ncbi:tachykinins [Epargyreus clarus]|uniref:tachykinins n=1 Tax=Epargyreus clarus TaxID=520877 RepID=UPI003C2C8567
MSFSKICVLFITMQLIYSVSAQEMVKRGPQGFLGMRGKKYIDSQENELYKRKPQFFVGVKGKKSFDPDDQETGYKRAPMGFMGMRGKKDYPEDLFYPDSFEYVPKRGGSLIGQIEYSADDFNQNQSEFPLLNELLAEYLQKVQRNNEDRETDENTSERISNEIDKRAANMRQFYGVRGKKSIQNKRPYDLSFRGKFIGVRGKKDLKNSGAQEIKFLLDHNAPWAKRKGQMGFFGMRGKKWTDDLSSEADVPN